MCLRLVAVVSLLLLSACVTEQKGFATIGAECRVFTDPGFAVQGKRPQDRRWITGAQEKGISSCGWRRPPAAPPDAQDAAPTTS